MTNHKKWSEVARLFEETQPQDFAAAAHMAGLDPAADFKFAFWSGADFRNSDLRRKPAAGALGTGALEELGLDVSGNISPAFDFTGARLTAANFKGALISGARFEKAILGEVTPPENANHPATVSDIANLRAAADWDAYCKAWHRPSELPDDAHLPTGAIFQDAPFAPEMIVVPPGRFMMGSPHGEERWDNYDGREEPMHKVTIDYRLAVSRFPVTFADWDMASKLGGPDYRPGDEDWGRGQRPVIKVSWDDAMAYCAWLQEKTGQHYRLLSEAEWEYVCRAGTDTPFWWGKEISTQQANYDGNYTYGDGDGDGLRGEYRSKTLPVESFDPNPWGLHQVHGNVWEWCADAWHKNYNGAPDDGSVWEGGDTSFRVVRGGSWSLIPQFLRSAFRFRVDSDYRNANVGFRVSRTLTP